MSINNCFIYLDAPMFSAHMFMNILYLLGLTPFSLCNALLCLLS